MGHLPPKSLRPLSPASDTAARDAPVVSDAQLAVVPNDEEVIEAIILASRAMVGIAVRSLAGNPDDVTLPQYRTLGGPHLRRRPDAWPTWPRLSSVSPSTATRMCDRLVRKGLMTRTRDELDRREVKLAITTPGRKVVADVIERRRAEVRQPARRHSRRRCDANW